MKKQLLSTENLLNETLSLLSELGYQESTESLIIESEAVDLLTESNKPIQYIAKILYGGLVQLTDNTNTENRGLSVILHKQSLRNNYKHLKKINNKHLNKEQQDLLAKRLEGLTKIFRQYDINDGIINGSIITKNTESYFVLNKSNSGFILKLIRIELPNNDTRTRSKVGYYESPINLYNLNKSFVEFKLITNRGGSRIGAGKKPQTQNKED